AEGQLWVSEALATQERTAAAASLATAQRRFYSLLRQADAMLKRSGAGSATDSTGGQRAPRAWRSELLAMNEKLAREQKFEDIRVQAEQWPSRAVDSAAGGAGEDAGLRQGSAQRSPGPFLASRAVPGTPYLATNRIANGHTDKLPRLRL